MRTRLDLSQMPTRRAVIMAIVAGMYWIWWDSFHEIGRFFMQVPLPFPFVLSRYSSVSCFLKPLGVVLGCLLIGALLRRCKRLLSDRRVPVGLFSVEIALHVLYYVLAGVHQYAAACFVYAAISACTVPTMLIIALQMRCFEKREIIFVAIGSIAFYGLLNNLLFPRIFLAAPLPAIGSLYLVALVAAHALSSSFSKQTLAFDEPNQESNVKTPLPLIAHLFIYGLAFGILHILGGLIAKGPYSTNIAVFFACLLTILCVAFLFLRRKGNHEIWSKIRSTVFPLAVIGYLLVPLVSNSDAALALTEAGNLSYNAIFFIGCFVLMRKTYVEPRTIITKGLLYKNLGTLAGVVWARSLYDGPYLDSATHSILSVIITLLLTVATFWVGSDEQIRKIWGLRKNLSPKQYNDRVAQLKCSKLSEAYALTARERQILILFAQGMRAPEIKEAIGVSMDTVRSHTKHLYAKLDVHSFKDLHVLLKDVDVDADVEKIE